MHSRSNIALHAAIALLLLLNIGVFLLGDRPLRMEGTSVEIPMTLNVNGELWEGKKRILVHNEEAVLAPAHLTSRIYHPFGAGESPWERVWLDMLESDSVGSMHNFFDSMVASGGKPRVLGTHTVQTAYGPLRTSIVATLSHNGSLYYMLLWYQSGEQNASNRWQWYKEVLGNRIKGRQRAWRLIKVATPSRKPDLPAIDSPEFARLEAFSKAVYEAGASKTPTP